MESSQHFENNHKTTFSEHGRQKLSVVLLSLTGIACIALLVLLSHGM